jgi:hypothetical protein
MSGRVCAGVCVCVLVCVCACVEECADKSRRPRVIMRRQKTLQLCLNSYLFSSMICDRAGPKDVRFTVCPCACAYPYPYPCAYACVIYTYVYVHACNVEALEIFTV